jgi:hypothetical protein
MTPPVLISIIPDKTGAPRPGSATPVLELHAGEKVTGTVEVKVLEDLQFGSFRIGFLWHTEGRGNRVSGSGGASILSGEGNWLAGDRLTFPFSVRAPWGPLSYSGRILSVEWSLEARVCRSMLKSDIGERIPLRLSSGPDVGEYEIWEKPQIARRLEAAKRGFGGVWFTVGLAVLLGSLVLAVIRSWDFHGIDRWVFSLVMAGGFFLTMKGIWRRLARGKLGEPTVQLSTTELRRGDEILYSLVLRPEQRTELRSLEVVLECEERVVQGHGQYRSHKRKAVYEKRVPLARNLVVEPHRGFKKKGTISVPEDGPPSFGAQDNQVVWWLHFKADIVGWPDWDEPHLLTVKP